MQAKRQNVFVWSDRELEKIPNPKVKQTAYEHIHDIAEGKRDFRF